MISARQLDLHLGRSPKRPRAPEAEQSVGQSSVPLLELQAFRRMAEEWYLRPMGLKCLPRLVKDGPPTPLRWARLPFSMSSLGV